MSSLVVAYRQKSSNNNGFSRFRVVACCRLPRAPVWVFPVSVWVLYGFLHRSGWSGQQKPLLRHKRHKTYKSRNKPLFVTRLTSAPLVKCLSPLRGILLYHVSHIARARNVERFGTAPRPGQGKMPPATEKGPLLLQRPRCVAGLDAGKTIRSVHNARRLHGCCTLPAQSALLPPKTAYRRSPLRPNLVARYPG